ncbi:acetyl-CoA carboxylase biotin carboxyl carrier protein subunit [Collimonas pratensis]|uniref:acetyl-CoA carboxylase biotin carboxyl carrier protein subunit n=1 Tax=Collimonas pratensis TaxID=279113 RepID=UPI000782BE21|nr:acetyl-CoA carboxylase biotin carboxyl carrier protein subunit [Collimonas pratensis]
MSKEIEIRAEIAGALVKIIATLNAPLKAGDNIAVMESMKMEIPIQAPSAGSVVEFLVEEGAMLDEDAIVARFIAS